MDRMMLGCLAIVLAAPGAAAAPPDGRPAGDAGTAAGRPGAGLSLQAFQARQEGRMMAADTDGDGRVSRAEFMAAAAATGRGDPAARFARMDRNGDGYLDRAEIDAVLARRFRRLDADGDGMVTAQERAPARPARGGTAGDDS